MKRPARRVSVTNAQPCGRAPVGSDVVEPIRRVPEDRPLTYWSAKVSTPCACVAEPRHAPWTKKLLAYGRRRLAKVARMAGLDVGRDQAASADAVRRSGRSRGTRIDADPGCRARPNREAISLRPGPDHLWVTDSTCRSTDTEFPESPTMPAGSRREKLEETHRGMSPTLRVPVGPGHVRSAIEDIKMF